MLQLGRQGRVYVVTESAFETYTSPASADAIRHINFQPTSDPVGKRNSTEKKFSPGRAVRFIGRETAALSQFNALIRPSGVLNTLPEATEVFAAAFGAVINTTLATTVASDGATTGATLTSAAGLVVGGGLLITCADSKKRVRIITAVDTGTGVVAWAPALAAAPANAAPVKACTVYKLTTALSTSLAFFHYLTKTDGSTAGFKRALKGVGIDKLALAFDSNSEPMFTASGPAGKMISGAGVDAKPAAFTTVGGNPPSGITGEAVVNGSVYDFIKAQFELTNGLAVRNNLYGTSSATELFRQGYREISVGLDTNLEDETAIYDNAKVGLNVSLMLQTGYTEGNIIGVYCPQIEFKTPDTPDPDTEVQWSFKGMALESADGMNDEMYLIIS